MLCSIGLPATWRSLECVGVSPMNSSNIGRELDEFSVGFDQQGVAKAVGSAGPKTVVQMIRMCLLKWEDPPQPRQFALSSAPRVGS